MVLIEAQHYPQYVKDIFVNQVTGNHPYIHNEKLSVPHWQTSRVTLMVNPSGPKADLN